MRFSMPIVPCCILAVLAGCHAGGTSRTQAPRKPDTRLADAENERAFKLIREEKFSDAEKALQEAIAADVLFGPARNNLGLVYYHQDKLYEAAWEFQNAIKLMPYKPEPRNNLGLVFEKAGKYGAAADEYARARQMEPDNPEYMANLARAWMRMGKHDPDTRALLEDIALKDSRAEWSDWARLHLLRLRDGSPPAQVIPTP